MAVPIPKFLLIPFSLAGVSLNMPAFLLRLRMCLGIYLRSAYTDACTFSGTDARYYTGTDAPAAILSTGGTDERLQI